jgi:molecular chaperone DnaJ
MAKNPYESLGVGKTASADEIKSAYRRLAKQYHPDQNPNNKEAEAKFKEINSAYEILSDEKKRANFDRFGSAEGMAGGFGGGAGGFSGFDFSGAFGGGMEDLFGNIFGGMGGFAESFTGARTRPRSVQGSDVHLSVNLSFTEAALGVKKTVTFTRFEKCRDCNGTGARGGSDFSTCTYCNGSGRVRQTSRLGAFGVIENVVPCSACNGTGKIIREKCAACGGKGATKKTVSYEVNIPAGIADGQTINIGGEGDAPTGTAEGISGNLLIAVKVAPHPILVRDEFDLYLELPISFTQAILGDKIQIPTIEGTVLLNVPPSTQNGAIHRLKGKGIKRLRSIGSGDLIVKILVEIPKNLDRKHMDLIKAMDQAVSTHEYPKRKAYRDKMERIG